MNWLDFVIAVIVAASTIFGFRKGFLRKILGIAGILLGFVLAVKFYRPISDFMDGLLRSNSNWITVVCFLLIIATVFSVAVWLARFMAGLSSGTTVIDKISGAAFGFIQGLILASVLVVNLGYLNYPDNHVRESSNLYPIVYGVAPSLFDKVLTFSPELKKLYEEYKKLLKPS